MSIPGSVFDGQPARRVPEESYNGSSNSATPSGIQTKEGIEKSGSEEPLQPMPSPSFAGKTKDNNLDDRNCVKSMAHQCHGYRDFYSKWHDKSESSFLGDASGKIPRPHGISELDSELPNRGLLEDKESHKCVAVDQGNRSSQIAG